MKGEEVANTEVGEEEEKEEEEEVGEVEVKEEEEEVEEEKEVNEEEEEEVKEKEKEKEEEEEEVKEEEEEEVGEVKEKEEVKEDRGALGEKVLLKVPDLNAVESRNHSDRPPPTTDPQGSRLKAYIEMKRPQYIPGPRPTSDP
ncbi:unnamed protein product [Boreogadus saida]